MRLTVAKLSIQFSSCDCLNIFSDAFKKQVSELAHTYRDTFNLGELSKANVAQLASTEMINT